MCGTRLAVGRTHQLLSPVTAQSVRWSFLCGSQGKSGKAGGLDLKSADPSTSLWVIANQKTGQIQEAVKQQDFFSLMAHTYLSRTHFSPLRLGLDNEFLRA